MGVTSKPVRLLVQIAHTWTNAQTRPLVFIRLPGDDDPGEPKAAVPSAGRDHDGGCESKPGSADGGFS